MKIKTCIIISAFIMTANAALIAHIYGIRFADFSEVPNSQRPSGLLTHVAIEPDKSDYVALLSKQ